jgi:phosphate transport system substrate-binding protein
MRPVAVRGNGNASPRERACIAALALLLVSFGAVAAEEFKIGGTGAAFGTMRLLAEAFNAGNSDIRITIAPNLGTSGGVKAVVSGSIGLAVSSRPMNDSERKLGAVETEYARTPFVFAVSTKSSVTAITSTELAKLYAGEMMVWPNGKPIRIVLRPTSDVDSEMVRTISPAIGRGLAAAMARPGMPVSATDQDAADAIEGFPGAVGPSSLAVIVSEKRAIRALKLDGRDPTLINAASGAYPYYKRLFFVTATQRPAAASRFLAFVQSPAGRRILEGNGQWIP